uniref:PRC-barrel domain-containing protein n=1 Tax=Pseudooceanicola nanhaiensis TaxID=375761 RepID=UPI00300BE466
WINGATVVSPGGETIGDGNDVIFDGETGELTAAILSVGGFLGIGSKQIAVDWDQITIDNDANTLTSNLTREEAEAAPEYAFRDQEQPPAPAMDTGTGMGTSTGTGMGSGTTQLN